MKQCGMGFRWLWVMMILTLGFGAAFSKNVFSRRYARLPVSVSQESSISQTVDLMKRCAAVGYNGILIDDSQTFLVYKPNFYAKVRKTLGMLKAEADKLNLHLMMYSHGQTMPSKIDHNTVEALPVRDTKFVVKGTKALAESDHGVHIKNSDMEKSSGNVLNDWKLLKCAYGTHVFVDKAVKHSGSASVRFQNVPKICGIYQSVALKPYRAYEVSAWIKTEGFTKTDLISFRVHGPGRWGLLSNRDGDWRYKIKPTQDWKRYTADFNSWDQTSALVRLQPTAYFVSPGKIWFDDVEIREVGLYQRVDRANLPVVVKSAAGAVFKEGKDYTIGKEQLTIPAGSAIKDGDVLKVSYYEEADMLGHPASSFCFDGTWDVAAMVGRKFNDILKPKGWFIKYSEWRMGYWDPSCPNAPYNYKTAGQYMGGTAKKTTDILRGVTNNCNLEPYVWSDSFDPYHNAKNDSYYMINGKPYESWKSLDPKTIVLSWNEGKKYESLRFFAGMDPKFPGYKYRTMISAWAESPPDKPGGWLSAIDRLEKEGMKDGSIIGMQYTSWYRQNYTKIEAFANSCKAAGRWGSGPVPWEPIDPKCKDAGLREVSSAQRVRAHMDLIHRNGIPMISYSLPECGDVNIRVTDCLGKTVQSVFLSGQKAGTHLLKWNSQGCTGVFFVHIQGGNGTINAVKKAVVF